MASWPKSVLLKLSKELDFVSVLQPAFCFLTVVGMNPLCRGKPSPSCDLLRPYWPKASLIYSFCLLVLVNISFAVITFKMQSLQKIMTLKCFLSITDVAVSCIAGCAVRCWFLLRGKRFLEVVQTISDAEFLKMRLQSEHLYIVTFAVLVYSFLGIYEGVLTVFGFNYYRQNSTAIDYVKYMMEQSLSGIPTNTEAMMSVMFSNITAYIGMTASEALLIAFSIIVCKSFTVLESAVQSYGSGGASSSSMHRIRELHSYCLLLVGTINSASGLVIILIFGKAVCMPTKMYFVVEFFADKNNLGMIMVGVWMTISFFRFYVTAMALAQIPIKAQAVIAKAKEVSLKTNSNEMYRFVQECTMGGTPTLHGCHFFEVNKPFVSGLIGCTFSYLIMLIQCTSTYGNVSDVKRVDTNEKIYTETIYGIK